MIHKRLYAFTMLAALTSDSMASDGFKKGVYAGIAFGRTMLDGKRSDKHVNDDGSSFFNESTSLKDKSARTELILGYFRPCFEKKFGMSIEGNYTFYRMEHTVHANISGQPDTKDASERFSFDHSYGGNIRFGPILRKHHFLGLILGFETMRFTRHHENGFALQFQNAYKTQTGFQYGLGYQYAWERSTIGVEFKQTTYPSMTLSSKDSDGAVTTNSFKPKINALMLRYTYRVY